jgi:hypothetical protein
MAVPRAADHDGRPSILVGLEVLMIEAVDGPRLLDDVPTALERLRWVGDPVVLAPERLFERALPAEPDARTALVRHLVGDATIPVEGAIHADEGRTPGGAHVEAWRELARARRARWLITDRGGVIPAARRAGLRVILVGARGAAPRAVVEPAEHEARDVLDAVAHILAAETFAVGTIG